jgi:hypothetical protein
MPTAIGRHPVGKIRAKKDTRQLDHELHKLKVEADANSEFDYVERAEIARKAQAIVHKASAISRGHPRDLDARMMHNLAVEVFRSAIARAYPPAFWEDYQRLKKGNPTSLATAVKFLEADPWFFRSGYIKAELIRHISRIEIPQDIEERLRLVVLATVDRRDRREFRQYCRLARKVDSPDLREGLSLRLQNDDPAVRRRARWVLDACEEQG